MSGVILLTVTADESDVRLDRWFKRRFPELTHGRLEKLLRTGQVRVDGGRVKSNQRLATGQVVRVPPIGESEGSGKRPAKPVSDRDAAELKRLVIYKDDELIAINKPAGLAVQGGSKTVRHLDGMLDALREGYDDKPRLVHRLDRDTSGVMIVARTAKSAADLSRAFQGHTIQKIYWALVIGLPEHPAGTISAALVKGGAPGHERMEWDDEEGKKAITDYRVISSAWRKLAWLELSPRTGRTHQLRAHCAVMGTPILGDGKYTGDLPALSGTDLLADVANQLCLHARSLVIQRPGKKPLTLTAPLPPHMTRVFKDLGFEQGEAK